MSHPFNGLSWRTEPGPTSPTTPVRAETSRVVSEAIQASPLFAGPTPVWSVDLDIPSDSSSPLDRNGAVVWSTVRELQSQSAEAIQEESARYESDHGRPPALDELPVMARPIIKGIVQRWAEQETLANVEEIDESVVDRYSKAVHDALYGLGRLQPLLEIPDAENVIISGSRPVVVDHNDGTRTVLPPVADSDADLMAQLQHMAERSVPRRAFDAAHLDMTLMVGEQFRIHAISNEISREPSVVIRQHLMTRVSLGDMVARQLMPQHVAEFLDRAVRAGLSIVVAGEQGVGKTTLLRALIHAIPINERFGTLETDLELFAHKMPGREHTLVMFARDGMGETDEFGHRAGQVDVAEMVAPALRQSLGRIIVGEVRGVEAAAMFRAMQSGTGTMSSIHSPSADQVSTRLADVVAQGRIYSIDEALRQVGMSVDLVIYLRRRDVDGKRKRFVEAIDQLGMADDSSKSSKPSVTQIYRADPWTGEEISFTPSHYSGPIVMDHLQRPLDRLEGDQS